MPNSYWCPLGTKVTTGSTEDIYTIQIAGTHATIPSAPGADIRILQSENGVRRWCWRLRHGRLFERYPDLKALPAAAVPLANGSRALLRRGLHPKIDFEDWAVINSPIALFSADGPAKTNESHLTVLPDWIRTKVAPTAVQDGSIAARGAEVHRTCTELAAKLIRKTPGSIERKSLFFFRPRNTARNTLW